MIHYEDSQASAQSRTPSCDHYGKSAQGKSAKREGVWGEVHGKPSKLPTRVTG